MEGKIESRKAHIAFLCEELEMKEKENGDFKNSIDDANKTFRKKTVYAEGILLEKSSLAQKLKVKEEQFFELKKQNILSCQNGCQKYNRSTNEIVAYADKNRSALIRF